MQTLTDPNQGFFGRFGGQYIPETLMAPVKELVQAWQALGDDAEFKQELNELLTHYVGRPTPLYEARSISQKLGGARIFLKREDLTHTGAHKINNTLGQALLAKRMGKTRIIAETGAGQHGVASATVSALLGLKCRVYMGAVDMERQALNVYRMRLLGAEVVSVDSGSATLKDAVNEAMRDWVGNVEDTFYILGSVLGPHPYPAMVAGFQAVIGNEARAQILAQAGRLPDEVIACVGGGSNAIGIFRGFLDDENVALTGVEAGGLSLEPGQHAARFSGGSPGVLHGSETYVLQNEDGQVLDTHSISAGLDYPAVGPEHAHLQDIGRVAYTSIGDEEALLAFHTLARSEGILPALESSHALAQAFKRAPQLSPEQILIVNLSGRGDKDVHQLYQKEIQA